MGCHHGSGYGHGCWGPWEDRSLALAAPKREPGYGRGYDCDRGYGRGYGYGRGARFGAPERGPLSRETAAAQLEAYLASLRDELRAVEADLDELRGSGPTESAPQV